ncbi:hypothetical protein SD70_01730 [Gordoniibacillus kamchatkensis]|uniref:Thioredoxin domain-containing protein n=1 Tax=Gordoniibacillus kamchatkensis TaxID=1590651 RepID=A0ABR5AMT2_9BACL|nr:redoxin domain-containing protein [Paenibacillus sp. VKM B-2647]KIL42275.1 hypothetical protein SD70_01730 [Paenibacillus sp. VKM B-2647]
MKLSVGAKAHDFDYSTAWSSGLRFYDQLEGRQNILLFLRYYGCTVCQLQIAKLIEGYGQFIENNVKVFVVLQSPPETIREQVNQEDIPFTIICDPLQSLYRLYDVGAAGSKEELGSPALMEKLEEIRIRGIQHGKYEGNEMQLPAAFIINEGGVIQYVHYGTDAGDVPSVEQLIALTRQI